MCRLWYVSSKSLNTSTPMEKKPSFQRLEARVSGRVQGVGFRYFTRQAAQRLQLTGWVRNEYDGAVRFVAEGPREVLERLLITIKQGPPMSRVDGISTFWGDATESFKDFSVRF